MTSKLKAVATKTTATTTTMMKPPISVGVDSVDKEHRIFTDSLNRTMKDHTLENLQNIHDILKNHFDHEEELIEQFFKDNGGKSSSSSFLATNSHKMDHERILMITTEIQRAGVTAATNTDGNGGSNGYSMEQGVKE